MHKVIESYFCFVYSPKKKEKTFWKIILIVFIVKPNMNTKRYIVAQDIK